MFKFGKSGAKNENLYAIEVCNVSKQFKIPHKKRNTVYENIIGLFEGKRYSYEEFTALCDVSFTVKHGETLGIIGENGSGKSTLLKIIAGVLSPNEGSVKVLGKIAPFLELGVGFQPELSAEDNVYLYGSIMGMKRSQIQENIDDIFEFSDLEKFRNVKLKNFSSGMYARLAFSTAISTDPDIILIDEALAVGDELFQRKCYDKIDEFRGEGKTILFVSHGLEAVKHLCERSILLSHGRIESIGYSEKVFEDYRISIQKKEEADLHKLHEKTINKLADDYESLGNTLEIEDKQPNRWGTREIEITNVQFYNDDGKNVHVFKTGEVMHVRMEYFAKKHIEKPVFGIAIYRNDGTHINGPNTKFPDNQIDYVDGRGEVEYIIKLPLLDGTYLLSAAVYDSEITAAYDHHHQRFRFNVYNKDIKEEGLVYAPCTWTHKRLN